MRRDMVIGDDGDASGGDGDDGRGLML